jgi:hypothetical protein
MYIEPIDFNPQKLASTKRLSLESITKNEEEY